MSTAREVFVRLLDENVDVWRPVQAEHLRDDLYRIADQPYESDVETWEFVPGDEVICEMIDSSEGRILAVTRRAS